MPKRLTQAYAEALAEILPSLTTAQAAMLDALLRASGRKLSLRDLAKAAGYGTINPVNVQLGRVGRLLYDRTGIEPRFYDRSSGDPVLISVFAEWNNERASHDDWAWQLVPEFAEALEASRFEMPVQLRKQTGSDNEGESPRAPGNVLQDIERADGAMRSVDITEREEVRLARIGQGRFRRDLVALWDGCSVTGVLRQELLRASHLKPWRDCTNAERLDPSNGLLLLPQYDLCVDAGLLSFDSEGKGMVSIAMTREERRNLSLDREIRLRKLPRGTAVYLDYHRKYVFRDSAA